MNRLIASLATGSILGLVALPAMAADLPQPSMPEAAYSEPVPAERFYWTGFYFGGTLGYGWGQNEANAGAGGFELDPNGINAGVHAGYNFMLTPNFLLGAEADIAYTDMSDRNATGRATSDWLSTVRGRIGWTFDRVLLYGTGGLAIAGTEWAAGGVTDSKTSVGWTVGGGVEGALTNNLTARLEYLYADFGDETYNLGATTVTSDFDEHIARVGLSYKF